MKKMLKMIPAEELSGITLDYAQVQKNPGRKATAKLLLNSSLRKHPFLFALRRQGHFARRNICDSAAEIPY